MPKLSLPDSITVTSAKLETLINELEYMLEGKIDTDNIYRTGGENLLLPSKKFKDLADNTRPVEGIKFFGNNTADNLTFRDDVFDPLKTLMDNNINLIALELKESFVLKGTPEAVEDSRVRQIKAEAREAERRLAISGSLTGLTARDRARREEFTRQRQKAEEVLQDIRSETNTYNRTVTFRIPPSFRLMKGEDIEKLLPDNYKIYQGMNRVFFPFVDVRSGLLNADDAKIYIDLADEKFDEVSFNIAVTSSPLSDTKYLNIDVLILALFEVLP